jgi:predicted kinase
MCRLELVIFVGLQGSGKSTFYRACLAASHAYISKDSLLNNRQPQRRQMQLIEQALEQQRSLVVDNTSPTVEVRRPLIEIGHQYGARVTGYFFEAEVSQAIARNSQRAGKAKVPPVAIYATAKKLQRPTYAEGFDTLYSVRTAESGGFEIQLEAKLNPGTPPHL